MRLIPCFLACTCIGIVLSCRKSIRVQNDHIAWADSVTIRAFNLMDGPKPAAGLAYIDSVFNSYDDRGVGDMWRKYNAKAHYYAYYQNDLTKRRLYVDSMFTVLGDLHENYKSEYARSMFFMARLLQAEKKYNQAFKVYYDGLNFAETRLDQCSMSDFSNALGNIRYQQEQYMEALPYLKQAYSQIGTCRSSDFEYKFILPQSILNSIALCYEKSAKPDSSIIYYLKALDFIQTKGKEFPEKQGFVEVATAVVEGNLGGAYMQLNNLVEAEKHLKRNISINDRPGYAIEDAQTAKTKLAKLYIDHRTLPAADILLGELQADLESGRGKSRMNTEIWNSWYRLKWLYYEKLGKLKEAHTFLMKYHAFGDSLEKVNSGLKSADLDHAFKEYEQQFQMSLLQKNSELKTLYLATALVVILMTAATAGVIWYYLNRSRKSVRQLTSMNYKKQLALAALETSQTENTRILKIVAHDLRGPIGAITALADLMLQENGRTEDDVEALEMMKTGGENSLKLVNNLLQVNTPVIEDFSKDEINVADLVQYCADMLEHQASKKSQRIEMHIEPVMIKVNYEKMWRVVSNVLSNAVKFSPHGAVIEIGTEESEGKVVIHVTDQGIGIPSELGERIFDTFTEAKRKGTSGEESYGLGLSISRQIVEAHGGRIWYENNIIHQGTTFKIELPANTVPAYQM